VLEGLSSSPRQEAPVAQVRPFIQQPPPREAGQENQPVEQVYAEREVEEGVEEGAVLVVEVVVVGTAAAVVVVDGVVGAAEEVEVEGWMKDVDVPSATPIRIRLQCDDFQGQRLVTYIQYPGT
jgi:hypothetical protein